MLELDDGTCIGEVMAIARYFEELHPEPPLMGTGAKQRAVIAMWEGRANEEGQHCRHFARWHEEVSARPSAKA